MASASQPDHSTQEQIIEGPCVNHLSVRIASIRVSFHPPWIVMHQVLDRPYVEPGVRLLVRDDTLAEDVVVRHHDPRPEGNRTCHDQNRPSRDTFRNPRRYGSNSAHGVAALARFQSRRSSVAYAAIVKTMRIGPSMGDKL